MRISELYLSIYVKGREVLFDAEDEFLIKQYRWYILEASRGGTYVQGYKEYKNGRPDWILLHNLIMGVIGIDHINGNGLDNRRMNLRVVTFTQNQANSMKRSGSSKYKGVGWDKEFNKWRARINCNNKRTFLGLFDVEEDAAKAYDEAARIMFGEFARLNFPRIGENNAHKRDLSLSAG